MKKHFRALKPFELLLCAWGVYLVVAYWLEGTLTFNVVALIAVFLFTGPDFNSVKSLDRLMCLWLGATIGFDVYYQAFPASVLFFLAGFYIWPRLERVRTTSWSFILFLLGGAVIFALCMTAGGTFKRFNPAMTDAIGAGLTGFVAGMSVRGIRGQRRHLAGLMRSISHNPA